MEPKYSRWNVLRRSKRHALSNEGASNLGSNPCTEVKTDDGNSNNVDSSPGFVEDSQNWTALSPGGTKPEPRFNHAATMVGRKMVVVGGESRHGLLDDVQVLHLGKLTWSALGSPAISNAKEDLSRARSAQQFPPCKGHSVVSWGKTVLLIGGQTEPPSDRVSVWAFDMETACWSRVEAKGEIPVARSGQSVTKAGSILIMFGGQDAKNRKLNDLHMFDLKSLMWLPLHCTGTGPSSRSKHVAALYEDRFLLIFGGVSKSKTLNDLYSLDFETMEWSKLKTRGFTPSPRAGCGGVLCGDKWYITGGECRKIRCLETLVFEVSRMAWFVAATSPSDSVISNQGFSLVLVKRKEGAFLVAFGGYNQKLSNEVEMLTAMVPEQTVPSSSMASFKGSLQGEDTQEHTPRITPALANGSVPCSCITVAKHNLTHAVDHRGSGRKSLSEASGVDQTSDVLGAIALQKQVHQQEDIPAEPAVQNVSDGSKHNESSDEPVLENMNSQSSNYCAEVESCSRWITVAPAAAVVDLQIPSELDDLGSMQKQENGHSGARVTCFSDGCGLLSLEDLTCNKDQLCRSSQIVDFESELGCKTISMENPEKRMGPSSDIQQKIELMLAAALRKNAIAEAQLSAAITTKEAAEMNLSAILKNRQNAETRLTETLKEIDMLKEKLLTAELAQEEANSLSNIVHAENVRLEHDLAFLKAVLDDTQKELHTTRGVLAGERARAFQLQVEVFQLKQKIQGIENRAPTPKKNVSCIMYRTPTFTNTSFANKFHWLRIMLSFEPLIW